MADRAGKRNRRTAFPGRALLRIASRLVVGGHTRTAVGLISRLTLLLAIVYAFAGPVDQMAMVAGVSAAPPPPARQSTADQDSGFAVADGPIGNYFAARGGVRTFGPPVSNAFPLLGERVQIFRDFMLKQDANGNVSTVNLFDMGGIPFRNVGGRVIPEVDQTLAASAPTPGTPDYGARVQQFIRTNAPDQFDGAAVGFFQAFIGTVQYEDAFPNGGERSLLAGFDQEVWGMPVSKPVRDAQNPDVILLRWERGVMVWSAQTRAVTAVPLGDTFKTILTGEGLGPERTAAAAGSPFLLQLNVGAADGVARPAELPDTVLATAFQPGAATVAAAQMQFPTSTPTPYGQPTATPYNGSYTTYYGTPTATPYNYNCATPTATPYNSQPGYQQPNYQATQQASQYQTANTANGCLNQTGTGNQATYPNQTSYPQQPGTGLPGAITPNNQQNMGQGSDPCYGDEQITFAPEIPRVANEVLIAVSSSRPHPYGRLAGTEKTNFVRERPGQLGLVWEWTIQPTYPGQHEYTFYVDSTIPCKKIQFEVRESLATKTPRPSKTPTPYNWNNNNGNSNNNNGNDNNTNSGSPPYRDPYQFANTFNDSYNCSFFYSQGETQRVLRANPSDPNNLDSEDGVVDGIACTTYHNWQYPNDGDYNPVQRTNVTPTPYFPSFTPTTGPGTPTNTPGPNGFNPQNYINKGDAFNCVDFNSQADAQAVLWADPNDPNKLDIAGLEPVNSPHNPDGIACNSGVDAPEWAAMFYYPQPYNKTPIPTPQGGRKSGVAAATYTPTPSSNTSAPCPTPATPGTKPRPCPTTVTNNGQPRP